MKCRAEVEITLSRLYFLPVSSLSCLNYIVTLPPSGYLESLTHPPTFIKPHFCIC